MDNYVSSRLKGVDGFRVAKRTGQKVLFTSVTSFTSVDAVWCFAGEDHEQEIVGGEVLTMTAAWTAEELQRIGAAHELQIASMRTDGTLRRWVPIWVVSADGQVYVRTWYRRDTGWFGQVLASHRARIRVPGPGGRRRH